MFGEFDARGWMCRVAGDFGWDGCGLCVAFSLRIVCFVVMLRFWFTVFGGTLLWEFWGDRDCCVRSFVVLICGLEELVSRRWGFWGGWDTNVLVVWLVDDLVFFQSL